jgi:hypothetical protein
MMIAGNVPQHLWPEVVQTAVMLLNLTPSPALQYKSPIQMLAELGPDFTGPIYLSHLRAYGCRAYIYDELKARGDKFISRYDIGKLVGYERGTHNIFYVYVPSRNKVVRTSNVTFDESRFDTTIDNEYDNENYDHITIDEPLYHSVSSGGEHNTDAEEPQVSPPLSPLPHVQDIDFIDSGIPELSNRYAPSADSDTAVIAQRVQTAEPELEPEPTPRRGGRDRHLSGKAQNNVDQGKTSLG